MKKLIAIVGFLVLTISLRAQPSPVDDVVSALRAGNASQLAALLDDQVELTLPDKSDSYSKAQAAQILRDFFSTNGVRGFDLKHKGDAPGGHFCIGTLQTRAGPFRTNVFMKEKKGKEVIRELRFQAID